MIGGLIQNATLLLSLAAIYSLFIVRLTPGRLGTQVLNGALFGLAAVAGMLYPLALQPGLIFDGRSVILAMAGVFAGAPAAAVAALMAGGYRLWLGGPGVYMGVATIVTSAAMGTGFHLMLQRHHLRLGARNLLAFGFVLHLAALGWVVLLPATARMDVLAQVALPFLVVLPLLTLVLGLLLHAITERESIRETQAKDRAFLRTLVQTLPDLIWVKDPQGVYLTCNPRFEQFFGASEADIKGRTDADFMAAREAAFFRRHDQNALKANAPVVNEESITFASDGHREILETIKTPMRDAEGQLIGVLGIARDVTSLRDREFFFLESQRAARIGSYKADFVADCWESSGVLDDIFGIDQGYERSIAGWLAIVHPDEREAMRHYLEQVVLGAGQPFNREYRIRRPSDGQTRWVLGIGEVKLDARGKALSMTGTIQDITERKQTEHQLQLAASVFAHSLEGIIIADPDNRIVDVNPSFSRITGYAKAEVMGRDQSLLAADPEDVALFASIGQALADQGSWHGELWHRRKDGETYPAVLSISAVRDAQQRVQNHIAVFSDNSENRSLAARLEHIAYHDHLTGVPNRRLLTDRLDQALKQARRDGRLLAVCYLDLDGFKPINDRHGHNIGDLFLVRIAERLSALLRESDTIARFGGDEFVLLLTNLAHPNACDELLERVLATIRQPIEVAGIRMSVSASLGATLCPPDRPDPDTLLRHADQAMYRAKESGKNRYHLYDPEQDRRLHARRDRLEELRRAIDQGELRLHYQPQVDLISREVVGFEALIRWQHPREGLLMPGDFLGDIEGSELEVSLGEWVIDTALRQLVLQAADRTQVPAGLGMSVNISPGHLLRADFPARLKQRLDAHPEVDAERLKLEILETAAISDFDQAKEVLTACRALGVRFALDDFGTGYSSLASFRTLPVDILKIDQSFVRDMLVDAGDMDIVDSVVKLSGAFHRSVIAEGIETPAHAALLAWLGCRHGQGYGIGRPMPAAAIPAWLAHWQAQPGWDLDLLAAEVVAASDAGNKDLILTVIAQNCRYWVERLQTLVARQESAPVASDPDQDPRQIFAPWLDDQSHLCVAGLELHPRAAARHRHIQQLARDLIALLVSGQKAQARARGKELTEALSQLLATLRQCMARCRDENIDGAA
jgi:diguanylate cyclase (GGDEF)-like protein/PAS domain S-box-containing protein